MAPVKTISLQGTPILTSDNSWSKERRMGLNQLKIWTSLPALPTPLLDGVTHQGKPTVSRFVLLIFCSRCTIAPHDIGVSFTGIHCQGHIPETKGGGVSWQLLLLSPPSPVFEISLGENGTHELGGHVCKDKARQQQVWTS